MKTITYHYETTNDKSGWVTAVCSDHRGIITEGKNLAHAKEMAAEATELMLSVHGKPVFFPAGPKPRGPGFSLDFDLETGLCLSTKKKAVKA